MEKREEEKAKTMEKRTCSSVAQESSLGSDLEKVMTT